MFSRTKYNFHSVHIQQAQLKNN
ncbi:unnamed protein product [Acanthoscelides obtectus]|uniref:Uncharacterized protein n=1 Tax=Acanthoscelides obtectus TaxID=200917 RepID=A0A9P0LZ84_ACAOB|nr:unnamed protein product [Acanthoscelides obtectus]CAK1625992.1 hypothetical protein AOBTE_LOCUS3530 [Acanthoscelides obtectus]